MRTKTEETRSWGGGGPSRDRSQAPSMEESERSAGSKGKVETWLDFTKAWSAANEESSEEDEQGGFMAETLEPSGAVKEVSPPKIFGIQARFTGNWSTHSAGVKARQPILAFIKPGESEETELPFGPAPGPRGSEWKGISRIKASIRPKVEEVGVEEDPDPDAPTNEEIGGGNGGSHFTEQKLKSIIKRCSIRIAAKAERMKASCTRKLTPDEMYANAQVTDHQHIRAFALGLQEDGQNRALAIKLHRALRVQRFQSDVHRKEQAKRKEAQKQNKGGAAGGMSAVDRRGFPPGGRPHDGVNRQLGGGGPLSGKGRPAEERDASLGNNVAEQEGRWQTAGRGRGKGMQGKPPVAAAAPGGKAAAPGGKGVTGGKGAATRAQGQGGDGAKGKQFAKMKGNVPAGKEGGAPGTITATAGGGAKGRG